MTKVKEKIDLIKKASEEKNGHDLQILDIRDKTTIADYFVVISGNSTTQVKAIYNELIDKMYEAGHELNHREGHETSRWVLMDYGDIVVHIFHKDERDYYKIERLWEED